MEDLNKLESACSIGKLKKGSCDPITWGTIGSITSGTIFGTALCCWVIFSVLIGLALLAYFIYGMVTLSQT
jgi:hypothetical protein